jgi:hypothetical protein
MHITKLWLGNAAFALMILVLALPANSFLKAQAIKAIRMVPSIKVRPLQDPDFEQVLPPVDERVPAPSVTSNPDEKSKSENLNRLRLLAKLKLNRLPSNILETWYKETKVDENLDMPPAPRRAFLSGDARFKMAVKQLETDFALGNWDQIGGFLTQIPLENAKVVYRQILTSASNSNALTFQGGNAVRSQVDPRALQPQYLTFDDLFAIASIVPKKPDEKKEVGLPDEYLSFFAAAFRATILRGNMSEDLIARMKSELEENAFVFTKRQCAKLLFSAGLSIEAGEFLPELALAKTNNDHEALNLLSQYQLALYGKEQKTEHLEGAWNVTQAILAADDVDATERNLALTRAVKLSSQVKTELGHKWLNDSFVAKPEVGMEVLGAIGVDTAMSLKTSPRSPQVRLDRLKLQDEAVSALFLASPEQASQWKKLLELLAVNWLREAEISYSDDNASSMGPSMQRDQYGNIFYSNSASSVSRSRSTRLSTIGTADLLEIRPSEEWLEMVGATLRPKFDSVLAQLYLKVSEEDLALPYIEKLAKNHPEKAESLVNEYISVWTRNHNPNSDRRRTNSYMFMYGFESRAESIPLTRSKQNRNLQELAELVVRLNQLIENKLDQKLVVKAFVSCHSTAEVYELDEIEQVFGSVDDIDAETIAVLASSMRTNLAGMWRDAKVQKDKKTKRKKKEIEKEVIDGYQLAQRLVENAMLRDQDSWQLIRTQAELLHDENNYRAGIKNSAEFSPRRKEAMVLFQTSARRYAELVEQMEPSEYLKYSPFTSWFYASLGACDLGLIENKNRTDPIQAPLIREAILSLPKSAAEYHMAQFANRLFNRMSSVKPQLKHKYLDLGLSIVGDHKQASEAIKVHEYYKDLVNEIRLETRIDGDARVGFDQPFGVYVDLVHTKEIERESGGFGRYLQNQNSSVAFSYNYGRPTNDYRDKFEEAIRETFSEQFEVMSVTFQKPDVQSLPSDKAGWRVTPYAYILLKSRGPQVDKIPPAHLDLDFLDTSGYAILPVESAVIPVESSSSFPRPNQKLSVTQILDERQAEEGKLVLEIKASAQGLVPDLDALVSIVPADFEVSEIQDNGVSVSQFDPTARKPTINSDRSWLVSLEAKPGLDQKPTKFTFPQSKVEVEEFIFQRYDDADLALAEATVDLNASYGKRSSAKTVWAVIGILSFGLAILVGVIGYWRRAPDSQEKHRTVLPEDMSPFAAISMLQDIYDSDGISSDRKSELATTITNLEAHYFGFEPSDANPNIMEELQKWTSS